MDSQYQLSLKTHDVMLLFKATAPRKHSLFAMASFKVAALYHLARNENVYAIVKLYQLNTELDEAIAWLRRKICNTHRAVQKKLGVALPVTMTAQAHFPLRCNTVLAVKLMLLLKLFDDYVVALVHAKQCHVFDHQNDFYRLKNKMKERVCPLLSKIAAMHREQCPAVTIQQYCDHDACYQQAIKIYGAICPKVLQQALASPVTPDLAAQQLNPYLARLQDKVQFAVNNQTALK